METASWLVGYNTMTMMMMKHLTYTCTKRSH
jgi:hypothetical protein